MIRDWLLKKNLSDSFSIQVPIMCYTIEMPISNWPAPKNWVPGVAFRYKLRTD